MCYSNASVNSLMASHCLLSKVDPNHDGTKKSCSICWQFSYFRRVSQFDPNQCHTTEHLKNQIAQLANQFKGKRQQDPSDYIGQY